MNICTLDIFKHKDVKYHQVINTENHTVYLIDEDNRTIIEIGRSGYTKLGDGTYIGKWGFKDSSCITWVFKDTDGVIVYDSSQRDLIAAEIGYSKIWLAQNK